MKYNWEKLNDLQKWVVFEREATLETHNGTTKQDFVNIIRWLYECIELVEAEVEE